MARKRPQVTLILFAFVATLLAMVGTVVEPSPDVREFTAAGFHVPQFEARTLVSWPAWLRNYIGVRRTPTVVELPPNIPRSVRQLTSTQLTLLISARGLKSIRLVDCGLTDARLTRIVDRQPDLVELFVDDNPLTEAIIPRLAAHPRLTVLSMDCENIDLATLKLWASKLNNPDFVTNTALRQIARNFLGDERYVSGAVDAVHRFWRFDRVEGSHRQRLLNFGEFEKQLSEEHGLHHRLEARHADVVLRSTDASGQPTGGHLSLRRWSTASDAAQAEISTGSLQEMLNTIGPVDSVSVAGLGEFWRPPVGLKARKVSIDMITPATKRWLESTKPSALTIRMGDSFAESVTELSLERCQVLQVGPRTDVFGEDSEPVSDEMIARFLNGLRDVDEVVRLDLHGFPDAKMSQPETVDFSRFQKASVVHLSQLAIDDESIESLGRLSEVQEMTLRNLPHVSDAALIATTRLPRIRTLNLDLDVELSPSLVDAICRSITLRNVTLPLHDEIEPQAILGLARKSRLRVDFRSRARQTPEFDIEAVEKHERIFAAKVQQARKEHAQ